MSQETSVYQYFDAAGHLLYVGVTGRNVKRGQEHARTKEWWPLVATSTVDHFPTRERALAEESYLIRYHQPPYNTQGKSGPVQPKSHTFTVPVNYKRSVLGRLGRQSNLADVDLDWLAPRVALAAHFIRAEYHAALENGETVAEFRARLSRVLTVEEETVAA